MDKAKLFDIKRLPMDIGRIVCLPLFLIFRVKKVTPEGEKYTQKISGRAIIAANHTSFSDPFILGTAFWYRRMFFLVAEVVMQGKLRSLLLKGMGCIKIERRVADIEAIKRSVNLLKEGRVLSVFPQGGIVHDNSMEQLKSGTVLMAIQSKAPIIPTYICKREHWYCRQTVVVGNTIYPDKLCTKKIPSTADIENITEKLKEEMKLCKKYGTGEKDE